MVYMKHKRGTGLAWVSQQQFVDMSELLLVYSHWYASAKYIAHELVLFE